jgi:REP element-mobilizing transposase RayT
MSTTIRNDVLRELGELHFGRKRVQPAGRDIRAFYEAAKDILRHELLTFSDIEIGMMTHAFSEVIRAERYTCYACALMPDHVHIVIRKHRDRAEQMIEKLQRASREYVLLLNQRNPFHPVWGEPGWKVFLGHSGRHRPDRQVCRGQSDRGPAARAVVRVRDEIRRVVLQ